MHFSAVHESGSVGIPLLDPNLPSIAGPEPAIIRASRRQDARPDDRGIFLTPDTVIE
jgi:hypothetical protein